MAVAPQLQSLPSVSDVARPVSVSYAPARRRTLSLRWIATALAVVLSGSAAVSISVVSERNARLVLMDEIESRLMLQARNLADGSAGALLSTFPELTIQPLVRATLDQQRELARVLVLDNQGNTVGDPEARNLGTRFVLPAGLAQARAGIRLQPGEALSENGDLLLAQAPILTADHRRLGTALVSMPRSYVAQRLDSSHRQQFAVMIIGLLFTVALTFMLMSRLLSPLTALRHGLERIGGGDLETPIRLHDRTELGSLAETVNDMARDLSRAQQAMLAQDRLEHEVDIARDIQRSLLPSGARRIGNAFVCGDQRSATEVGGDYYDVLTLPDGRVAIAIADVAGKGLPGCLVMAMLSASLHALRGAESSPAALLARIDAQFAESLRPGMFVTMFYGVLDPESGEMVWASAGHNPMLIYRAASGSVERSASRGIPIGAIRGGVIRRTLSDQRLRLAPGDVMVHCTDGYTEAMRRDTRELFGLDRMSEVVDRHGAGGAEVVMRALIDSVGEWTGGGALTDDETLLVVEWNGPATEVPTDAAPLALLADARGRGHYHQLHASTDVGQELGPWLRTLPGLGALPEGDAHLLHTALAEVCANVAEHGYGFDRSRRFDAWWLPGRQDDAGEPGSPAERARRLLEYGCFVVRDDARPFRPVNWKATDFGDPRARARGRGFGLDIIFRVMRRAEYYPGTRDGNVTVLAFGPQAEQPHHEEKS